MKSDRRLEFELKRLQQAQGKPAAKPVIETKIKPAIVADEPTGFDWRNVPNAELNGDRRRDAYVEKLCRSVEAIQEYNAGLDLDEPYAINSSSLR